VIEYNITGGLTWHYQYVAGVSLFAAIWLTFHQISVITFSLIADHKDSWLGIGPLQTGILESHHPSVPKMNAGLVGSGVGQPRQIDVFSGSYIRLNSAHRPRSLLAILFGSLFLLATIISAISIPDSSGLQQISVTAKNGLVTRQKPKAPLLNVMQATLPVNVPDDTSCTLLLMDHSFGWSYDKPFIGEFPNILTCSPSL
jgi:hypothetical protein